MNILASLISMIFLATASLNWQASTDPKTYGYKVHYANYSTPAPYPYTRDVGNVTSYTFTDLSTSKKYCFAVTLYAYTSARNTGFTESNYSNRQCGTITVHPNFANTPNYRTSGSDNPAPANYPYNPLPDCTQCHS
jgi:hypothetical protein